MFVCLYARTWDQWWGIENPSWRPATPRGSIAASVATVRRRRALRLSIASVTQSRGVLCRMHLCRCVVGLYLRVLHVCGALRCVVCVSGHASEIVRTRGARGMHSAGRRVCDVGSVRSTQ